MNNKASAQNACNLAL